MATGNHLDALFARLETWRHYPAYRLEPRVDVLFSLYMRQVLEAHLNRELVDAILPELPIRRGTIYGEACRAPNKSLKVDFVLFGADRTTVYFVELKTDGGSRRDQQDDYLDACAKIGFPAIVEGILSVVRATDRKYVRKYLHLLSALEQLGFIALPAAVFANAYPTLKAELVAALREIVVNPSVGTPRVEVLFVQPEPEALCDSIGFEEFARVVEQFQDPLSQAFAQQLLKWRGSAGGTLPGARGEPA